MQLTTLIFAAFLLAPTTHEAHETKFSDAGLGINFMIPSQWTAVPAPPHENNKLAGVAFTNVDDAGTIVAIQSTQQAKKIESPSDRAKEIIKPQREAAVKRTMRLTDDHEMKVADCPGWFLEAQDDQSTTAVVCFVINDREFLMFCASKNVDYQKVKPVLMKLLSTIELTAAGK